MKKKKEIIGKGPGTIDLLSEDISYLKQHGLCRC